MKEPASRVAIEMHTGEREYVCLYLQNDSERDAAATLSLNIPAGIDIEVEETSDDDCDSDDAGWADDIAEAQMSRNTSGYLEGLLEDFQSIRPSLEDPLTREHVSRSMERIKQAYHETRILAQFLHFMKQETVPEQESRSLEWTTRMTSLETLNRHSHN